MLSPKRPRSAPGSASSSSRVKRRCHLGHVRVNDTSSGAPLPRYRHASIEIFWTRPNVGWPQCAVHVPPISGRRSRPTNRLSRLGPASPAPGPPRDGQTVDCGESAPRSRRSWPRPLARRGSAVPTAGAPVGWPTGAPRDEAASQAPGSGTRSVGCAGISRPPRPGRRRPPQADAPASQAAASVPRRSRPRFPSPTRIAWVTPVPVLPGPNCDDEAVKDAAGAGVHQ